LKPDNREQFGATVGSTEHHENMSNNKLFVGNLSFNVTENSLQDTFAAHGTVVEANLMMDRVSGRPRGFGFVTMSTAEEAEAAINALNGKSIDGRALTVNVAKPREERTGGGGGGGYGGGSRREYSGGGSRNRY
jgi:RNA recognition motif-containing protein